MGAHNAPIDTAAQWPDLERLVDAGVPTAALAFYGRWWQLENWLREVVYVELRARYGVGWVEHLQGRAQRRLAGDQQNSYMASADADELLAYTDVSALFELVEDNWELFEQILPPKQRWRGRADELRELRNRNAHCRRPHADDLVRLEQTLRDLERGAWLFYSSYVDAHFAHASRDAVGRAWIRGRHPTAETLIGSGHAERQYETRFWLGWTARPWADAPDPKRIAGTPGVLWHARWSVAGHELNVADLWRQIQRHDKPSRISSICCSTSGAWPPRSQLSMTRMSWPMRSAKSLTPFSKARTHSDMGNRRSGHKGAFAEPTHYRDKCRYKLHLQSSTRTSHHFRCSIAGHVGSAEVALSDASYWLR